MSRASSFREPSSSEVVLGRPKRRHPHGPKPAKGAAGAAGAESQSDPGMGDGALRELATIAADPERWPSLDEDTLLLLVFQQAFYYAHTQDPEAAAALALLYPHVVSRVPESERLELQDRVTMSVEEGHVPVSALLPFLQHESSPVAVALAAVSFATLMPLEDGDEMTGPRTLVRMAAHADDDGARIGLLSGLLQLGDRRVLPLLASVWDVLEPESRVAMAALPSPSKLAFASSVEFWLGALEAGEPAAADALVRIAREAEPPRVLDVRRKFPAHAADDRDEISVLDDVSIEGYGARMAPRLAALGAEHVLAGRLADVRAAWGIADAS